MIITFMLCFFLLFPQAAVIDESDIWIWWKVGNLAMDVVNLRLARFAFEKVRRMNFIIFL